MREDGGGRYTVVDVYAAVAAVASYAEYADADAAVRRRSRSIK